MNVLLAWGLQASIKPNDSYCGNTESFCHIDCYQTNLFIYYSISLVCFSNVSQMFLSNKLTLIRSLLGRKSSGATQLIKLRVIKLSVSIIKKSFTYKLIKAGTLCFYRFAEKIKSDFFPYDNSAF